MVVIVGLLLARKVDPTLQIGGYEAGKVEREGALTDKLDALSSFLGSYIEARVLAYLGGFQTSGVK